MDVQTLAAALAINEKRKADLVAAEYDSSRTYALGALVLYKGALYECTTQITTAEAWNPAHWTQRTIEYYLAQIGTEYPRLGVSGVGGSSATLTRLWDAVGLVTPTPGTDAVTCSSAFDQFKPFNRKKCVGHWSLDTASATPKAKFTVEAYYGDADYAEDGTMGDYVAVEIEPFYYFEGGGMLGVSEHQFPGWKIHPVCVDLDGNIRAKTYIPCYAMGLKDGKPVSLPGYHNEFGGYKALVDKAKLYGDGSLDHCAILEPSAVDHYEWLLMTIEYATQNMQTVMQGACSMAYSASDIIHAAPDENKIVVTGTIGDRFCVGQSIVINASYSVTPSDISTYNIILSIDKCDEDGTLNASGTYRLITYDGTDRSASIVADTTQLGSKPWISGATQGAAPGVGAVRGHTGSPVSNSNSKYPNLYRWRENVYGNQNMTCMDLFDVRVEDEDTYHLDWYFLKDPRLFYPYANAAASDLVAAKGFVKLGVTTPASSYADGYIKELGADPLYPHVHVPVLTSGGSASTYYCDYAYLVNSTVVRSVRRRGSLTSGASFGPCFVLALYVPSTSYWNFGGGLFFIQ